MSTRNTNKEHRIPLANSLRAIQSTFENSLAPIYIKLTDSIGELVNAGRLAGKQDGGGGDVPFPASFFVLVLVFFFFFSEHCQVRRLFHLYKETILTLFVSFCALRNTS